MTVAPSIQDLLSGHGVELRLQKVLLSLCSATATIADVIKTASTKKVGTCNSFGDEQLSVDIVTNNIVFDALMESNVCDMASSEENNTERFMGGKDGSYSVAFDPLDGSSIIDANMAVGSIFGVFPSGTFVGRCGRDMLAAAASVYGPRTSIVFGLAGTDTNPSSRSFEVTLYPGNEWRVTRTSLSVAPDGKIFAPGNLRATAELADYRRLVDYWIAERYTLRYSGGMVPDVYHILIKGKGVFCNPPSERAPAKLRLLYEVAPMSFIIECSGGFSSDPLTGNSILDRVLVTTDDRTGICLGSSVEVERFNNYMITSQ